MKRETLHDGTILDLSKLENRTTHLEWTYRGADIPFDFRGYVLDDPWLLQADVTKNPRGEVTFRAHVKGTVQVNCDRCLEQFPIHVDEDFRLYFLPMEHASTVDEQELTEESLDENFYRDPRISLVEIIHERIMLQLPMKVLCREECQGLCARCGGNLNAGACACTNTEADPRFALLDEMKKRMKSN